MRPTHFRSVILFVAALSLAGCAVGPNYKRPTLSAPTDFRGASNDVSTNSLADLPWWRVFRDPVLQDLIHVAPRYLLDGCGCFHPAQHGLDVSDRV